MVAIAVVSSVIGVYQSYLTNVVGQRVMRDLRATLYEHLQGLSLRFFTSTKTGEIQSRLANDVGGLQSVITDTASTLLSNSVILISTLIAMFVLSWKLTHPVAAACCRCSWCSPARSAAPGARSRPRPRSRWPR